MSSKKPKEKSRRVWEHLRTRKKSDLDSLKLRYDVEKKPSVKRASPKKKK